MLRAKSGRVTSRRLSWHFPNLLLLSQNTQFITKPNILVNIQRFVFGLIGSAVLAATAQAKIITVTTTNSAGLSAGSVSLTLAIQSLGDGDTIQFALPGKGPFFLNPPANGYPWITNNNIMVDGYSQTGSSPNTNTILARNHAKIMVVLDARNGNVTAMDYDPSNSNTGYGTTEFAVLGIFRGSNVVVRGLSLLAPAADQTGSTNYYGVAFARDYNGTGSGGQVSGCWIGVAPDGVTLAGTTYAITGFRHRGPDGQNPVNIDNVTVGVAKASANPRAEFNVIAPSALPVILEGGHHRISGNFMNVLPDGVSEYNVALDALNFSQNAQAQGMIQIGRDGNGTVIGTDGDGVNDADERNVMSGTLPPDMNGYNHSIEFYGSASGASVIVAGNYIGMGVDGVTRFTNGVPVLNAGGSGAVYQVGSNLDGVSDALEGNVFANNWPFIFFSADILNADPSKLDFFDSLSLNGFVSARGNTLIDNYPFPVSPFATDSGNLGIFWEDFYANVMATTTNGVVPIIDPSSTASFLSGSVPAPITGAGSIYLDVYIADPEGLTNGIILEQAGLTNDWVQGKTYLGTLLVDGHADLNPATNSFKFDIRAWNVPAGTVLTATANYAPAGGGLALTSPFAAPVVLTSAPSLNITPTLTGVSISWSPTGTGFFLQSATNLASAVWQAVPGGTNPPVLLPTSTGTKFFRLAN